MGRVYSVKEYDTFTRNKELNIDNYTALPEHIFDNLELFVLSSNAVDSSSILDFMTISTKKGVGKVITVKNYVGIIVMNDGTTIEVLPKIYSHTKVSNTSSKKILLEMLKSLVDFPFKTLQTANMHTERLPVFEIFIKMFVSEIFSIVKRGLKCNYDSIENSEQFYKGKIKFNQNVKYNHSHKEKVYIEYDEFNTNRPENRIIKSTLEYLYRKSNSYRNKNDIRTLLTYFLEVPFSDNYKIDIEKVAIDRNLKDYKLAMQWCKIFLTRKSFTTYSGNDISIALLFPMQNLFENYIAKKLNKYLDKSNFNISVQDRTYHLFDYPNKKFLIKPDIIIKHRKTKQIYILDTKWKILSMNQTNYGISQNDMYQMYVYQRNMRQ